MCILINFLIKSYGISLILKFINYDYYENLILSVIIFWENIILKISKKLLLN